MAIKNLFHTYFHGFSFFQIKKKKFLHSISYGFCSNGYVAHTHVLYSADFFSRNTQFSIDLLLENFQLIFY